MVQAIPPNDTIKVSHVFVDTRWRKNKKVKTAYIVDLHNGFYIVNGKTLQLKCKK